MLSKSTLLHLRIPFSFFLLPIFLFAVSQIRQGPWVNLVLVFVTLHLLLYPASNGYNSYFDRDESSIGGLRNPPKVSQNLYTVSLLLDLVAVLLGLVISWQFSLMLLIYGLVSKAYSHPDIRLKRYPWISWFIAGFFQGCFSYMMAVTGLLELAFIDLLQPDLIAASLLCSLLLWGSYPMTQIYQHQEDLKRGDITLSQKLGILGTFHFTAIFFLVATAAFLLYFTIFYNLIHGLIFIAFMLPVIAFFGYWYVQTRKDPAMADFDHAMRLNFISSMALNTCFLLLYLLNH